MGNPSSASRSCIIQSMSYMDETFGVGGHISRALPNYQAREGQIEMVYEIESAIDSSESTIIEAPTGVGKSLAYLVPVTYWLAHNRERIIKERQRQNPEVQKPRAVIVTANIALQEQLMNKDVPFLQKAVPWEFKAMLLKGKSNYLCLDRFDDTRAEFAILPPRSYEQREQWGQILKWVEATRTGDFSELDFEIMSELRPKLSITADDCLRKSCPRIDDCHPEKARKSMKDVDVIVTNYHLLFTHVMLQMEFGANILPPFDLLVLDEVHAAADISKDFFGFKIGHGAIKYVTRLLGPSKGKRKRHAIDPELQKEVLNQSEWFFGQLRDIRKQPDCYPRILSSDVVPTWRQFHDLLLEVKRVYQSASSTAGDAAISEELNKAVRRCGIIAAWIEAAMSVDVGHDNEKVVYFIEHDERTGTTKLCSKPLHVDDILRSQLFESPSIRSVIGTSATIATEKSLDFVMGEIGAEACRDLVVESPFDFQRQCLFVVPTMPDPKLPEFGDAVAARCVEIARASNGRMLGLFTSYKSLKLASERMKNALHGQFTVLVQGEGPRMKLVQRFKEDVHSILLGTKSFWQGVDIQGEALSCVVIDRIPFDPPDDPIISALSDQDRRCFMNYQIPRASIDLKQGFGRLIRSTSDKGVVVCLDKRILESRWGKRIYDSLPMCTLTREVGAIASFFNGQSK